MSLTRKLLKDLGLGDETAEQIIQAHVATVDALRAERDDLALQLQQLTQAHQEAADVQAAFDAFKAETAAQAELAAKQQAIRAALERLGANRKVIPLLLREVDAAQAVVENGVLVNAQELLAPLKAAYAEFFATPALVPTPACSPALPRRSALTRRDVSRMTPEEINRNWNEVKSALMKGD